MAHIIGINTMKNHTHNPNLAQHTHSARSHPRDPAIPPFGMPTMKGIPAFFACLENQLRKLISINLGPLKPAIQLPKKMVLS